MQDGEKYDYGHGYQSYDYNHGGQEHYYDEVRFSHQQLLTFNICLQKKNRKDEILVRLSKIVKLDFNFVQFWSLLLYQLTKTLVELLVLISVLNC